MKNGRITYLAVLAVLCCLLLGCTGDGLDSAVPSQKAANRRVGPSQRGSVESVAEVASFTKLSPIEAAQKDYLDAYNEYVRLLRESGPQTIETLQALALYQKSYQLYQMLLKAGDPLNKPHAGQKP